MILGVKIIKKNNEFVLKQSHYIEKLLRKFGYFDCKPIKTLINPHCKLLPYNSEPVN